MADVNPNACAVILAGGRSSRMGTDKSLLDFGGQPLIQRIADQLRRWFATVVIVTNTPEAHAFLGLPMVGDRIPGLGPLGGLEAGLRSCWKEYALVCACDMPFLSGPLIQYLVSLAPGYEAVVPEVEGRLEPLCAVYARSLLPRVTARIEARRLKLQELLAACRLRTVSEAELRRFGEPGLLLMGCNTPAEWEQARRLWAHRDRLS